jgi:hypothetical protein
LVQCRHREIRVLYNIERRANVVAGPGFLSHLYGVYSIVSLTVQGSGICIVIGNSTGCCRIRFETIQLTYIVVGFEKMGAGSALATLLYALYPTPVPSGEGGRGVCR